MRTRFLLVFLFFSVLLSGYWVVAAWTAADRSLDRTVEQSALRLAELGAELSVSSGAMEDADVEGASGGARIPLQERLSPLDPFVVAAYLLQADGAVFAHREGNDPAVDPGPIPGPGGHPEALDRALDQGTATTGPIQGGDGKMYGYGFARIGASDSLVAVLVVIDPAATVGAFRRSVSVGAILALILSVGLAAFLATGVAAPLDRLSREALRVHRGQVSDPIGMDRPDEVGRLARALDMMRLGTLERDEQSRLMMAQVADEIRGPLEALQKSVTLAEETEDDEEREALLSGLRGEIGSIHRIVGDFMELARPLSPRPELRDIRSDLESAVELVRREAEGQGLQLDVSLPEEPLLARIDPRHVRGIVLNLLRNAAQAGSRVWLAAEVARGEVVLTVRDDGPGVREAIRDRVFDAFVTDKAGHPGLGLAIVRRLAEGSGGRVELTPTRDTVGDGAEFRVYLQGGDDLPPTPAY